MRRSHAPPILCGARCGPVRRSLLCGCAALTRAAYTMIFGLLVLGFGFGLLVLGFGGFGFGHKNILKVLFVETLPRKALSNQWTVMKDLSSPLKAKSP